MATLAAPRPGVARLPQRRPHLDAPPQTALSGVPLTAMLALFAIAVHGYHPLAEDGGLYLAGVKRLVDPALYRWSAAFVLEPTRYSAFAPFVSAVARLCGSRAMAALPWIVLLLHYATVWLTFFAAWLLTRRLFPGRHSAQTGAVLLLACWLALPVAGTALLLMDPYLTARSISTPCMILGLVGVWDATQAAHRGKFTRIRGLALWLVSLAAGSAMHPLMAAYSFAATLALAAMRAQTKRRAFEGAGILGLVALALAAVFQASAAVESPDYVSIANTRSYWFLAQWRWYEWAGIVAPLAISLAFAAALNSSGPKQRLEGWKPRALAHASVFLGVTATTIALVFARQAGASHLVASLQPMRALQVPYLVMILLLGALLGEQALGTSLRRRSAAAVLLSAPLFAASRSAYPQSDHLELPQSASRNPWVQAFLWIRDNTPKDALFALDDDYIQTPGEDAQCFRAIAERSALPDRSKDGGEAAIAPDLTAAWQAGQAAQHSLSSETDATRRSHLRPLGVSWVVLNATSPTGFQCPYRNSAVKACRLR